MFKQLFKTFKSLVNFPGLSMPPETIPSASSLFSIHFNIALLIATYAFFGELLIAIGAALILLFDFSRKNRITRPLNKKVLIALQTSCIGLFFWQFNGSTSGQSWMGLLMLLICLKSLESKNLRDFYVTTLMMFFLAAIIFAYNNSAFAPVALGLYSVSLLSSLMLLSHSRTIANTTFTAPSPKKISALFLDIVQMWKPAGKIFLQALPITILLFLLFPRIQGSFGFLPNDNDQLSPNLSNLMNAGSFSQRASSQKLAFRAEFPSDKNGNPIRIRPEHLYWRVKTFSQQDGFSWNPQPLFDIRQYSLLGLLNNENNETNRNLISYTITHQPSADNFLPALETVIKTEMGLILDNSSIKTRSKPNTFRYKATSSLKSQNLINPTKTNQRQLSQAERDQYTQTTLQPGEQTRQLLNSWLEKANLPQLSEQQIQPSSQQARQLALSALTYFREQPFSYHLIPPEVDSAQPIEDFLFNTQSGYCEHYSSTFSTLMRWLNIPTRIVVGFQGGDYNPNGSFYEIRYSSAHAWNEIWTDDAGWIRADPTAFVAPERIEFGMDALFALMKENEKEGFKSGDFNLAKIRDLLSPSGSSFTLQKAQSWFDSVNHSWDKWVVNYNFDQQRKLLKKLGLDSDNQYITLVILLGICLSIFMAIVLWLIWPKRIKRSPVEEAYINFKAKIRKLNIPVNHNEGPLDLNKKLIQLLPHHATDIQKINQYYIENQYRNDNKNLDRFIQAVKQFRPKSG